MTRFTYHECRYKSMIMSVKEVPEMFARLTKVNVKADKIDQSIDVFQESIVQAAQEQEGFKGILLLTNRETGDGISISFWESEEHAAANEASHYYQNQLIKRLQYYTKPPIREGYEVSFKLDKKT